MSLLRGPTSSCLLTRVTQHRLGFLPAKRLAANFTLGTRINMVAVYANGTLIADSDSTKVVEGNHVSHSVTLDPADGGMSADRNVCCPF